jgi:predicted permease
MKLLNWFRRAGLNRELDRELQYHYDRRVDDLVSAGIPETEARRRITAEIGGLTQVREEVRDVWFGRWLSDFVYDLRYSARAFLRSPAFTVTTLLSLALGIGATTAIYSLVDQVVLHSLPVRDPERLALVDWKGDHVVGGFGTYNLMSYPICRDLQQQTRFFDGVLCRAESFVTVSTGGDPRPVMAEIVSGSYFSVLGIGPTLGRVIEARDDAAPGGGPVAVLSYDFWQAQLGGAPDVIGRTVLVNHNPLKVIGVAAREFRGIDVGEVPALWVPACMAQQILSRTNEDLLAQPTRWMQVLGRLQPGVTAERAQTGLQPWFKAWLEDNQRRPGFPVITAERRRRYLASSLSLTPAPQGHSPLRRSLSQPLWVLFAATGVLLGLACLNVAGLFLARGSARGREIGTRLALGASRGRIGRQLLADSLLLALAGGGLGVAFASPAMRALIAFLPDHGTSSALRPSVDFRLLGFALLASLAAGLLSGFTPALHAGRDNLISALRERAGTVFGGVLLRKCIVTLQVAFSLILVVGAALFARTLSTLVTKGPGFDTGSLVSFSLGPRQNGYTPADSGRLIRRVYDEVGALPTTRSAALINNPLLFGGSWNNAVTIQSDRRIVTGDVDLNAVSPGFFSMMGVRILDGRDFDARDSRPTAELSGRPAIVNQAFVKRYLDGRNPLGLHIGLGSGPDVQPSIEIVGVCADFHYRGLREISEQAWFPISAGDDFGSTFYIRINGTPEETFQAVRRIVRDADPQLPVLGPRTLDDQVNRSLSTERLLAALSAGFGALALLLSLIGLYGVMSFVVTRRTREIGIRLALGATAGSAVRLILRDAFAMIAAGIAIALPCVAALGKLVQSQLFGVSATDPATVGAAAMVLAAGAFAAALIPAWRAATVNPTDALRLE